MIKKGSKRLVIDASIAFSAGQKGSQSPVSKNCRNLLLKTREICHQIVFSKDIKKEWDDRASPFSKIWLKSMIAKKKFVKLDQVRSNELRNRVKKSATKKSDQEAMLKDIRLIEATLETDRIVISRDDEVRRLYCKSSQKIKTLKNVMWVNPTEEHDKVIEWLKKGAKPVKNKMLGSHSSG